MHDDEFSDEFSGEFSDEFRDHHMWKSEVQVLQPHTQLSGAGGSVISRDSSVIVIQVIQIM